MKSTEQDLKEFDKYVAITVHELCKAIDEINKAEEIINTEHCAEIQMREPTYLFNGTQGKYGQRHLEIIWNIAHRWLCAYRI